MTPDEALKFVTNLAQTALGVGAFKTFATALQANDAIAVLTGCVDDSKKIEKGMLVPVESLDPTKTGKPDGLQE